MPKLVPFFSTPSNKVVNLAAIRGLAVGNMVGAGYYDLQASRASDVFFSFNIYASGPGHIGLCILPSLSATVSGIPGYSPSNVGDNAVFSGDPTLYPNLQELAMIPCSSMNISEFWTGSIGNLYGNLPPRFALTIVNYSAAAFDAAAAHEMTACYSYYEYV